MIRHSLHKYYSFIFLLVLICLTFSFSAFAAETSDRIQFGDNLEVFNGQTINGDAVTISGNQKIAGKVNGSAVAIFGDIEITGGSISGDAVSVFGRVTLKDNASVMGDAIGIFGGVERQGRTFIGGEEISIGPQMAFDSILRNLPFNFASRNLFVWRFSGWFSRALLSILITLALIHFMQSNLEKMMQVIQADPVKVGLRGLLGWLVLIVVIIIIAVTIIGIPVAFILGVAGWLASVVGLAAIYLLVGREIVPYLKLENPTPYMEGVIGAVLFAVLTILPPYFSGLIKLLVSCLSFGAVIMTKFGTNKRWIK